MKPNKNQRQSKLITTRVVRESISYMLTLPSMVGCNYDVTKHETETQLTVHLSSVVPWPIFSPVHAQHGNL